MRDDRIDNDDDLLDRPAREEQLGDEEVSQGRDVHDITRGAETHGRDVVTDAEQPGIASHGRTVVDHSHIAEARGVDVIDEGPATPEDESQLP